MYEYEINGVPPTYNNYMGNSNNFNKYRDKKSEWAWRVLEAVCRNKPKKPIERCVIEIKYCFHDNRRRDPDNYSGKFILDGLRSAKVLKDDSFKNIETLIIRGRSGYERDLTVVRITEV